MKKKVLMLTLLSFATLAIFLLGPTAMQHYRSLNHNIGVEQGGSVHLTVWKNGEFWSVHPGNLTDYGESWIRGKLFVSNATIGAQNMTWWGNTNSTTAYAENWVILPSEITTGNMTNGANRWESTGANVELIGANQCNLTFIFMPSETNSTRRAGLYAAATGSTLICTDVISPVINYAIGDTITLEFSITIDEA